MPLTLPCLFLHICYLQLRIFASGKRFSHFKQRLANRNLWGKGQTMALQQNKPPIFIYCLFRKPKERFSPFERIRRINGMNRGGKTIMEGTNETKDGKGPLFNAQGNLTGMGGGGAREKGNRRQTENGEDRGRVREMREGEREKKGTSHRQQQTNTTVTKQ